MHINWKDDNSLINDIDSTMDEMNKKAKDRTVFVIGLKPEVYNYLKDKINADMDVLEWHMSEYEEDDIVRVRVRKPA